MYVCCRVCTCDWSTPQRPKECIQSPGTGVAGTCELPDMGTGNQTQVPCKKALFIGNSLSLMVSHFPFYSLLCSDLDLCWHLHVFQDYLHASVLYVLLFHRPLLGLWSPLPLRAVKVDSQNYNRKTSICK